MRRAAARAQTRRGAARPPTACCTSASRRTVSPAAGERRGQLRRCRPLGEPSRTASATLPGSSSGRCGTHASRRRQAAASTRGEIDAVDGRPAFVGVDEAEQEREQGRLAGAARPDDRDPLARLQLELDAVENAAPLRVRDAHAARAAARPSSGAAPAAGSARLEVDQLEEAAGRGEPVGARVELGRRGAKRCVQLRCEHEDRERRRERDAAVHEPDPELDGDDRSAERRGELEREGGEERDPQRRHRRAPVVVGVGRDRIGLRGAAAVGAQRRQAANDVDEVRRRASRARASGASSRARSPCRSGSRRSGSAARCRRARSPRSRRAGRPRRGAPAERPRRGRAAAGSARSRARANRPRRAPRPATSPACSAPSPPGRARTSCASTRARSAASVVAAASAPPLSNAQPSRPRATETAASATSGRVSVSRPSCPRNAPETMRPSSAACATIAAADARASRPQAAEVPAHGGNLPHEPRVEWAHVPRATCRSRAASARAPRAASRSHP